MAGAIDIQNIQNQKSAGMQDFSGRQTINTAGSARSTEKANKAANAQAVTFMAGADHANDIADGTFKTSKGLMPDISEGKRSASHEMDIVMSHMLSKEDYKQAREEGYDPSEIEADEAMTIVDRIKAEVLKGGTVIAGMNDNLSIEQLAQVTGGETAARALDAKALVASCGASDIPVNDENVRAVEKALSRAGELTALTDNAIAYLIENELTPSVDNLYLAEHAAKGENRGNTGYFAQAGGYVAARGNGSDLNGLDGQIDDVIAEAGLQSQYENAKEQAGKLLGAGIALTPEHLNKAVSLSNLSFPLSADAVISAATAGIAMGRKATQGDLLNAAPLFEQAKILNDGVQNVSDEALMTAVKSKEAAGVDPITTLTVRDLMQAQNVSANARMTDSSAVISENANFLQARLQLEEVRFSMSITTNITLMRRGISIDTTPMRDLIGRLQNALQQNALSLFGPKGADKAFFSAGGASSFSMSTSISVTVESAVSSLRLFEETNAKASFLRDKMPVGVLGALSDEFKTDTLDDIYSGATTWKVAGAAYESMQTEIRRDLGDSIKKAFRNADSLLNDLGVAVNEDSLRAVRILSYNKMEVSLENVNRVTEFDARLNQVLNDLKPAAVLDLIRSGRNPLQMTLEELNEALTDVAEGRTGNDEKYARFLYKLDANKAISSEERKSFIGIYRMFETLKKTDHAAIGTLLNTGADMSIKNLLTATRTLKNANGAGINLSAGDFAEGYTKSGITNAIDLQIEAAFSRYSAQADTAFAHIEPEKMKNMESPEESGLTEFATAMETLPADKVPDASFDAEQTRRIQDTYAQMQSKGNADDISDLLTASGLAVNTANLESLSALFAGRNGQLKNSLWENVRGTLSTAKLPDTEQTSRNSAASDAASASSVLDSFSADLGEVAEYAEAYSEKVASLQQSLQELRLSAGTSYGDFRAVSFMNRQLALASHMAERGSFEIPLEKDGRMISMQVTLAAASTGNSGMTVSYETTEYGFISASFEIRSQQVSARIATTNGETPQEKKYMERLRDEIVAGIGSSLTGMHADPSSLSLIYGARAEQLEKSLAEVQKQALAAGAEQGVTEEDFTRNVSLQEENRERVFESVSEKKRLSESYFKLAKLFTQAL